jgi:putative DNA primase/helicase
VENGLLNLRTARLSKHTRKFFNTVLLPFAFDRKAAPPARFLSFVDDIFDHDQESIDTLQEMTGYLLGPDTSLQKIFLFVGPPRSGKGTLARAFSGLLGRANVASLTLASFQSNFGLQSLIAKSLAVISDARLGTGANHQAVVERLLSISGEDSIPIDRKYLSPWNGTLPTRILILTNELPRFPDTSGALPSRLEVLRFQKSYLGKEDPSLTAKLLTELPGILNWALKGLRRLRSRGYFLQPKVSRELVEELDTLGNPVRAFVNEECELGPNKSVTVPQLCGYYGTWASENGFPPLDVQVFGRDLHAAIPNLRVSQPRVGGERVRRYVGVTLRTLARGGTRASSPNAGGQSNSIQETVNGHYRGPARASSNGENADEGLL